MNINLNQPLNATATGITRRLVALLSCNAMNNNAQTWAINKWQAWKNSIYFYGVFIERVSIALLLIPPLIAQCFLYIKERNSPSSTSWRDWFNLRVACILSRRMMIEELIYSFLLLSLACFAESILLVTVKHIFVQIWSFSSICWFLRNKIRTLPGKEERLPYVELSDKINWIFSPKMMNFDCIYSGSLI